MKDSPLRRVVMVLTVYLIVGWVVLGVAEWARRVLVLPGQFETLLRGGMLLGIPLAALLAWKYPTLGQSGATDGAGGEEREGVTESSGE